MTDIRTRLADALAAHRLMNARCEGCGESAKYESLHQADVLLSLPGIAIVELPERNDKGGWSCGCDGQRVWVDHQDSCVRHLGETRLHNPRALAAALLAAANAAEDGIHPDTDENVPEGQVSFGDIGKNYAETEPWHGKAKES